MKSKNTLCLMMSMVLVGIMAVLCAAPVYAAGNWGNAVLLPSIQGLLAGAARDIVRILVPLLQAMGVWAAIGGGAWYIIVRRGDYSAAFRRYALATAIAGCLALVIGVVMQVLDAPGWAYMSVLRMLW